MGQAKYTSFAVILLSLTMDQFNKLRPEKTDFVDNCIFKWISKTENFGISIQFILIIVSEDL